MDAKETAMARRDLLEAIIATGSRKQRGRAARKPAVALPEPPEPVREGLAKLMAQLKSDDEKVSLDTVARLYQFGLPRVLDLVGIELAKDLRSKDETVKAKASTLFFLLGPAMLGFRDPQATVSGLALTLIGPDPVARRQSVDDLGKLGKAARTTLPLLQQLLLKDTDPDVCASAVKAIELITAAVAEHELAAPLDPRN